MTPLSIEKSYRSTDRGTAPLLATSAISSNEPKMDANVDNFVAITGASGDVARGFIEMAGGDYERAVELYFENPELVSSIGAATSQARPAASSRRNIGREDDSGVIHIDSDDDEDMDLGTDSDDGTRQSAMQAAALAQEEEDAAMAKRLQEELYGAGAGGGPGGAGGDDVRAPIARTTETLVAPDPSWGMEDDAESAILEQLRRRRPPPGKLGQERCHHPWPHTDCEISEQVDREVHLVTGYGATPRIQAVETARMERTHDVWRIFSGRPTT